jgi:hypothetical protein
MPIRERRQHFRIEDHIYFEYKIMEPGCCYSEKIICDDLMGEDGRRYLETTEYFHSLDYELAELTKDLAMREPAIAHYLNLLNAKIDYLVRNLTLSEKMHLKKVNIGLGGMSFKSNDKIKEQTCLKIVIFTKPKMTPIVINALVVYCKYLNQGSYRVATQFEGLTYEQEQLLSQHIIHTQVQCRANS